jgi:hypothetical protein
MALFGDLGEGRRVWDGSLKSHGPGDIGNFWKIVAQISNGYEICNHPKSLSFHRKNPFQSSPLSASKDHLIK